MIKEKIVRLFFLLLRWGMGIFFLYVASLKLFQINELQASIARFDIFPESWNAPLSYLGLACEFVVGVCLLFRKTAAGAALIGCGLTLLFTVLFIQGWIRGLSLTCNCLGSNEAVDSYISAISWRFGLFILMMVILADALRKGRSYFNISRLDFGDI